MRVITGKAKGRKLMMVPGAGTRPITDRAKEALFSIMGNWIEETRVLDLFGGTGGVGIESLSRGATWVDFIDLSHQAVETIRANLRHCGFERQASVTRLDSFAWLQRYHGAPYDLIYVAPPQYQGMWLKALTLIDGKPELLAKNGSVIVQIHPREETPVMLARLVEYDRRRYGSVLLLFYAVAEDLAADDDEAWDEEEDDADFDDGNFDAGDFDADGFDAEKDEAPQM